MLPLGAEALADAGNAPFDGPPPGRVTMTIAWALFLSIVAATIWGVLRIIGWLIGW